MNLRKIIINFSINHYKLVSILILLFTLCTGMMLTDIIIDTDPENMLRKMSLCVFFIIR